MTFKPLDIIDVKTSVQPVVRVLPILSPASIGSAYQEATDRATQFEIGKEYLAHVVSKIVDSTYAVRVTGGDIKGIILKMDLGSNARVGKIVSLRYMHNDPVPTFLLSSISTNVNESNTDISTAALVIGQYLKQAENEGVINRFQSTEVVTHMPSSPKIMAQDLKSAVSQSGLFYESHLVDLINGSQNLAAIKQESQNQFNPPIAALMAQQLSILENQRLSWHGEVWPGQKMDWDVYLRPEKDSGNGGMWNSDKQQAGGKIPVFSEMTLHLPHLGRVKAKLSLDDGRLRINIFAEQSKTLEILNNQKQGLNQSIIKSGQQLDVLAVSLI